MVPGHVKHFLFSVTTGTCLEVSAGAGREYTRDYQTKLKHKYSNEYFIFHAFDVSLVSLTCSSSKEETALQKY
jgi:hypothetical protein